MVEARWLRRVGPGIAAIGALVALASTTVGAPARTWDPPPCPGQPAPGRVPIGAWYRLDPSISDGIRTGQRLTLGRAGADRSWHVDLEPESFAAGPYAGTVLAGTDDGRTSTLSLIDLAGGCRWDIASSSEVIRRGVLAPDGASVVEFRVARRTRADLGVWRRRLNGDPPTRILGPIQPDDRFGPTWLTELSFGDDGRTLVVESCAEVACRFRFVDLATGDVETVTDPSMGSLVGLAGDRLVVRGACRGIPCRVAAIDRRGGSSVTLHATAGQTLVTDDGTGQPVVLVEDMTAPTVHLIRTDGRVVGTLAAPAGQRLVGGPAWASGAAEHPPGWVLFAPDGRVPVDWSAGGALRHLVDGRTVRLHEVPR